MGSDVVPELIFDQGLGIYYPATTDYYGYYYTETEPPNQWDKHHHFFGADGQDPHVTAMQTETFPNVYYIPSYGYVQSSYNPYNPSIPGPIVGQPEASFSGTVYHPNPAQQLVVSSPAYIPVGFNSSSDSVPSLYLNPSWTTNGAIPATKHNVDGKKLTLPSISMNNSATPAAVASEHVPSKYLQSSSGLSQEIPKLQEVSVGKTSPSTLPSIAVLKSGSVPIVNQGTNQIANLKVPSAYRPAKVAMPTSNGFTSYGPSLNLWNGGNKLWPRCQINGACANGSGNLTEQNRGPRADIVKRRWMSPLMVKAYSAKAGAIDGQGNITISADHYNRDDFQLDYEAAKFFVIKSYSEDDVHKSIKYCVWSSTPSGNKRLDSAFDEARKSSLRLTCPIFLFFSVNASGQFCGVAEVTGPVDFQKDMDFWQQDKWLGSFPVKWHIIKDVSNTRLRHILLENNEYRPVTCSRDTQEIPFLQGISMLRIFKNAPVVTSILDDFMHYEERERILADEKARIPGRRCNTGLFHSALVSSETVSVVDQKDTVAVAEQHIESDDKEASAITEDLADSDEREAHVEYDELTVKTATDGEGCSRANDKDSIPLSSLSPEVVQIPAKPSDLIILGRSMEQLDRDGLDSILKIGSLLVEAKTGESQSAGSKNDVITIGSMHIKVGSQACPGVLTVGSIPIGPNGF
ncbi:hypothetical protein HPP92_017025 [Vanilla planifolia]|uniref:YTH domain-containing family protein n=1 Tax=Vanilla planifolia TaxID=51239 RepID=A0A835QGW3_VANPL|nr:hypothetical protein HPP92_017025 [Vanilla planifolia]